MSTYRDALKGLAVARPAVLRIEAHCFEVAAKVALVDMPDCIGVFLVTGPNCENISTFVAFRDVELMKRFIKGGA